MESALLADTEGKIKTWCFGHYHGSVDRVIDGVRYVDSESFLDVMLDTEPLLPAMIESITRQMKHIRSLPLWPIRSVRWYLINRFTIPNRSVRELYFELRG